jgi:hypothetical protein
MNSPFHKKNIIVIINTQRYVMTISLDELNRMVTEDIILSNEVRVDVICEKTTGNRTVFRDGVCMEGNVEIVGNIIGNLSTGSPSSPSESYMGGGVFYNDSDTVSVITNSSYESGVWTDHTNSNADSVSSIILPLFQGNSIGQSCYIGSNYVLPGVQIDVQTPFVQGESSLLSFDYWNGVEWVSFTHLDTNAYTPYESFVQAGLENITRVNIRMGVNTSRMSSRTLNGISKYWIRLSVVSPLSVIPTFSSILAHTDALKVNADGFIEYFGNSRPVVSLPLGVGLLRPFNRINPSNVDVYLSDGLGVGINENSFSKSNDNSMSFNVAFPDYIDTSYPVLLDMTYMIFNSGNGDSKWVTRWGASGLGDPLYISSANRPPTSVNEKRQTTLLPMDSKQNNIQHRMSFPLDISHLNTGDSYGTNDNSNHLMWITIERLGSNPDDTFPQKVVVVQVNMKYVKWSEGGNVRSFPTNNP